MKSLATAPRSRAWIRAWVVLDVCGLCCVAALWLVFGGGAQGLGPYFQAVGRAAISWDKLLLYTVLVSLYSAVLEIILRMVQDRLLARSWSTSTLAKLMGIGVPALLYGLTHSIYHLPGVLYALVLGLVTASVYAKWRSRAGMAAWHVQWNLVAITGSMALAVLMPGAPRDHMVATYKLEQIARGTVVRDAKLGWIDRNHYDEETYDHVLELASLPAADSPALTHHTLVLNATLRTQWGTTHAITRRYAIASHEDPAVQRAIACGVTLDFQEFHERAQYEIGWWSGLSLSAYQRDDLAAAWALCMDKETGHVRTWPVPDELPDVDALAQDVSETLTLDDLSTLARDTDLDLWSRVLMAKALWRY